MKYLLSSIIEHTNNISLKRKLIAAFFALTIIPFGAYSVINYVLTSNKLESDTIYSSSKVFEQAASFLEYKIQNILYISDIVKSDSLVQKVLKTNAGSYNVYEQTSDFEKLILLFLNLRNRSPIYPIRLYIPGGAVLFRSGNELF